MRHPAAPPPAPRSTRTTAPIASSCALALVSLALLTCSASPGASSGSAPTTPTSSASATATTPPPDTKSATPTLRPDNVGIKLPPLAVCQTDAEGNLVNPIEPGRYTGLLRSARCEQQKFLVMARVAGALGVACEHCHVPDPDNPKKFFYKQETSNKKQARWMEATFIRGLARKNDSPMRCANCHRDEQDKPSTKMLGDPRNVPGAQVWMHEVMTTRFVERNQNRLRCRTCHVGMAPSQPGWTGDVISAITLSPDGLVRK